VQLTLTIAEKKYVVDVEIVEGEEVRMQPTEYQAPAGTPQPRAAAPVAAPAAAAAPVADGLADDKASRSPIAGVVQKVIVEVGQTVAVDDLLAVLEAMKMETKITSHVAGTVKKIYVAAGDPVKSGQVIVEFE
jgi:methylmalonyl-CoA carboxyltransferase small subunit